MDIAVDPLEGTTLCAKDMPGAIAVMALAEHGSLLAAPDVYMQKIAIGHGYPQGLVDLDASPADNIAALARHKGCAPSEITAIILDRPRHMGLVAAVRETGAGIRLISDGDIAGIIHTTSPDETGADIYLGIGAAPEGVIAAGVLRCIGGHMQGRLILDSHDKRERAARMGISDPNRKYELADMARGDVIVAATGVTDGALLQGVRFKTGMIVTETVVYRSSTGTVRRIVGEHRRPSGSKRDRRAGPRDPRRPARRARGLGGVVVGLSRLLPRLDPAGDPRPDLVADPRSPRAHPCVGGRG